MSKRRFPYRKLDETERIFIETRLVRGHAPEAIRDAMNLMTRLTPEEITRSAEVSHTPAGRTIWHRFSGRPEYTVEDVRRAYDRLRKSKDPNDIRRNLERTQTLMGMKLDEDNRNAIARINPNIRPYKRNQVRKLADAGMLYRLARDADALEYLEDYYNDEEVRV